MLRRALAALLLTLAVMVGVQAPAQAATTATVSAAALTPCSNSICFATVHDGFAFMSYPASTPRNTCKSVVDGQTTWINNATYYRWYVFDSGNCTGTHGIIYPRTEAAMTGPWYRTIGSTYRTSTTYGPLAADHLTTLAINAFWRGYALAA